jgi:predicted alpha/beta-fold hydrolase
MPLDFPPFRPHPLVRGGHLQTIVGSYLPGARPCPAVLHQVALPDGDALAVYEDAPADPRQTGIVPQHDVVILVHGLGGCSESSYMLRCSAKLRERGFRVFRMNLRGCGAGIGLARQPLHAGRGEDAAAVLEHVHAHCPHSPIHLVGFSMGANIVLKLAGELGGGAPPHLASVMAVSPPIDLVQCTRSIQRGLNRIYDRRFVRCLVKHTTQRIAAIPDALSRPLTPRPRRLVDFDSVFTAPLSGFADVDDYYTRASSGPVLGRIAVPTLIITAASDPIVPVSAFEAASYSATTQVEIAPCGGHLGFVAARGIDPDRRWLDWRVVDWVAARAARSRSPVTHQADQRAVQRHVAAVVQLDGAAC